MQKIILDTNVIVSALIQQGYPYKVLEKVLTSGNTTLCVFDKLLQEYHEVLFRPKFTGFTDFFVNAHVLLLRMETISRKFTPQIALNILPDKDDNMLLELALESNADFLVTGNTNDFMISSYLRTRILTPKEYFELS
ncbi:MAG: putative toxin-antitoxin system toxin component, PIN family [Planctomycetaceae bacterium]|nr:putative toxin-antitoxin system toxin component, PIN family [Planctomycetaceae bacterium]